MYEKCVINKVALPYSLSLYLSSSLCLRTHVNTKTHVHILTREYIDTHTYTHTCIYKHTYSIYRLTCVLIGPTVLMHLATPESIMKRTQNHPVHKCHPNPNPYVYMKSLVQKRYESILINLNYTNLHQDSGTMKTTIFSLKLSYSILRL